MKLASRDTLIAHGTVVADSDGRRLFLYATNLGASVALE
jgi:hypothetical protein